MKNSIFTQLNKPVTILINLIVLFLSVLLSSAQSVQEVESRMMKQADENIEKYRKGDVSIQFINKDGKPVKNAEVEIKQETHDFLFGCIIFDLVGDDDIYKTELFRERFKHVFNLAVLPFYWPYYEWEQGMPEWKSRVPVIEWCRANGMTTKGHPLVWACESGVPRWLRGYSVEETEELLKARVINTVNGFEGKIDLWDVVNEPIHVKTWQNKISNLDDENDWGVEDPIPAIADYVEKALQWAHQADPSATLLINEYQTLADESSRQRYYDLLKELRSRNTPFSDIGIQAHEPRQEWFNPETVWKTFDLYASLGLTIHITEFTPQSSGVPITGGWRTGGWTPEAQTEFTEQMMRLSFGYPAVASFVFWGLSDRNSWLDKGGLIDEEYRPKPVYRALDKLINETWHTELSAKTDDKGRLAFRGFYGKYTIRLKSADGTIHIYPVHVRKDEQNDWRFTISH
jgi:GH35 family endo-1,4-beta-xylanase